MSGGARSSRQWDTGRESDGTGRLRNDRQIAGGHEVRELRIVDVRVDSLVGDTRLQGALQRVEEGAVGLRVPEVAALRVGEREALRGGDDVDRPDRLVEALGHQLPERLLLVALEAHEGGD